MEMTKEMVLSNLKELVGREFQADEIICAFEDFEESGETTVYVGDSSNVGYDKIAYIDSENSTQFLFTLDANHVITGVVHMAIQGEKKNDRDINFMI